MVVELCEMNNLKQCLLLMEVRRAKPYGNEAGWGVKGQLNSHSESFSPVVFALLHISHVFLTTYMKKKQLRKLLSVNKRRILA